MSTTTLQPDTDTDMSVDEAFRELTGVDEQIDDGTGNHERFSHYVDKEDIVKSATTGVAVNALCGKKWRPSKNPQNYPVCPECKKVHEKLRD